MFGLVELGLVIDLGRGNPTLVHQSPEQMARHRVVFHDNDV